MLILLILSNSRKKHTLGKNSARRRIDRGIHRLSFILAVISGAILALMMFLTVADVILRYFFNKPILGAFELTEFMMVMMVFSGLAYNQVRKGNIGVDVVVNKLRDRARRIAGVIASLLGLGLFVLMTWRVVVYGLKIMREHQISRELGLPISPIIFLTAFFTAVLCLVLLLDVVKHLAKGTGE